MLFKEALDLLQSGESMCRASWSLADGYLKLMDGMKYVWKIVLNPQPNAGNFIFCVEDFLADDWKKFEMPKESIDVEVIEGA